MTADLPFFGKMDLAAAQLLGAILRRAGANTAGLARLKLGYL